MIDWRKYSHQPQRQDGECYPWVKNVVTAYNRFIYASGVEKRLSTDSYILNIIPKINKSWLNKYPFGFWNQNKLQSGGQRKGVKIRKNQLWQQIGQPRTQMFVYYIHGATVSGRSRCGYLYYKCSGVVFLLSFWGVSCGGCFHFSFIRYLSDCHTIFNGNKHHHWWITVYASTVFMHRLCLFYPIKGIIWWIRRNFVPCICIFMQMSWRRFYVLCTYSTP